MVIPRPIAAPCWLCFADQPCCAGSQRLMRAPVFVKRALSLVCLAAGLVDQPCIVAPLHCPPVSRLVSLSMKEIENFLVSLLHHLKARRLFHLSPTFIHSFVSVEWWASRSFTQIQYLCLLSPSQSVSFISLRQYSIPDLPQFEQQSQHSLQRKRIIVSPVDQITLLGK